MKKLLLIVLILGSLNVEIQAQLKKYYSKDILRIGGQIAYTTNIYPIHRLDFGAFAYYYVAKQNALGLELEYSPFPLKYTYGYRYLGGDFATYQVIRFAFSLNHSWHFGKRKKGILQRCWYFKQTILTEFYSISNPTKYTPPVYFYNTPSTGPTYSVSTSYFPEHFFSTVFSLGIGLGRDFNINKKLGLQLEFNFGVNLYTLDNASVEMYKYTYSIPIYIQLRLGLFFRKTDNSWSKK